MSKNFIDRAVAGEFEKPAVAIQEFVAAWHEAKGVQKSQLHDWLGMTWEEYSGWVEDASSLSKTIMARRAVGSKRIAAKVRAPSAAMRKLAR